jgi:hypothetical protein
LTSATTFAKEIVKGIFLVWVPNALLIRAVVDEAH